MKLRVLIYCLAGGLPGAIAAIASGSFAWWWLSGIVTAAVFVPIALFGPRKPLAQFATIAVVLLVVTTFCTWSEAMLFVPAFREHAVRNLAGSIFVDLVTAAVLAGLTQSLKLSREGVAAGKHRSPAAAAFMVVLCGMAYLVYYAVFGGITYQFFTKPYYAAATQAVSNMGLWFWAIQVGRGTLMTLAVLPVIYTLRMRRWQSAIAVGLLIWVAGGLAPLLLPNNLMGSTLRMIHIVEIFTQNVPLGITAVLLLRPKSRGAAGTLPEAAPA